MIFSLIGMPGCGKSTLGEQLAFRINYEFCDLDRRIDQSEGRSITDIFAVSGEEYFRTIESEALKAVLKGNRRVVSTGGGIVCRNSNIHLLRTASTVVFINRPIDMIVDDINTRNRPILANNPNAIYDLYEQRYDLYKSACHIEIMNIGTLDDTVKELCYKLEHFDN